MMPDMPYEIGSCKLKKDDLLMLYTDGVTEAMTEDDIEFEEKGLMAFLRDIDPRISPEEINMNLIMALNKFCAGAPQTDDITILTLKML
jgi:sigma-B regulation protein RsbU (phosphoserine phosphatase)